MADQQLVEIRALIAADSIEHGELLMHAIGDTLNALVGEDRYGVVLFEGVNPNGTEVPDGYEPVEGERTVALTAEELLAAPFDIEVKLSASGHKTEDPYPTVPMPGVPGVSGLPDRPERVRNAAQNPNAPYVSPSTGIVYADQRAKFDAEGWPT